MRNFETRFNRRRSTINFFIVLNLLMAVGLISAFAYFGWILFTTPEAVGEFFGRIANGFNSAK